MKAIAFLFGAGVSIPACMPSTKDLTKEILCDYDKWCISNDAWAKYQTVESFKNRYSGNLPDQKDIYEIGNFLHKVHSLLTNYFDDVADITYEDIYDALYQIRGHISKDFRNPLIKPFLKDWKEMCENPNYTLIVESLKFIEDVVRYRLLSNGRKAVLSPLIKIINTKQSDSIHIFTLNFDTLIEELLRNKGFEYCDGFTLPLYNNQVNLWQMESLMNNNIRVKLYKLHGSLDRECICGGDYHNQIVRIINLMEDYPYFKFGGKERVYGRDTELMGISNKLLSYNYGIYLDLIGLFNLNLKECKTLIISGYSFSDYGINLRISDWMARTKDSRIIFIDPYSETTLKKSRGAIYSQFGNWINEERMIIKNENFQNWDANL